MANRQSTKSAQLVLCIVCLAIGGVVAGRAQVSPVRPPGHVAVYTHLSVDVLRVRRIELDWGYVEFGKNEVSIISTVDDPPKLRLGCACDGLGGVSFNHVDLVTGRQDERVLVQGKSDERWRGTRMGGGEMTVHLQQPGLGDDAAMRRVLEVRSDQEMALR